MISCRVCGCEFQEGLGNCPNCNFAYIVALDGQQDTNLETMAAEHRRALLEKTNISLELMKWNQEEETSELKTLEKPVPLQDGQITWLDEPIAGVTGDVQATLRSARRNHLNQMVDKRIQVTICPQSGTDDWNIGLERTQEGYIRLCMRCGEQIGKSEPVNVL